MRKSKKPIITTGCGDWHETWGMGTNKVGKLTIEIVADCPINFTWEGHSQGRHGQTWNKGAKARFMVTDGRLQVTERKGDIPGSETVIKSANILLREHNLPELV